MVDNLIETVKFKQAALVDQLILCGEN